MKLPRAAGVSIALAVLFLVWLRPSAAVAHVANPARLELREVEAGTFEVTFALPIIEGRRLRAEPVLPEMCEEITARDVQVTPTSIVQTWKVRCEPHSLAGEPILVLGLLGTQTDLMLKIETLEGRQHNAVLKPGRPFFVVPQPPSVVHLIGRAALAGLRSTLRRPELWVLFLLIVFVAAPRARPLTAVIVAYAAAHAAGQSLAGRSWFLVSPHLPAVLAALTVLVPSLDLGQGRAEPRGWIRPAWLCVLLLGLLYGGARPETVSPEGLSNSEQGLAAVVFAAGTGLGLALLVLIALEFRNVLRAVRPDASIGPARLVGYLAGTVAFALLLLRASVLPFTPGIVPAVVFELVLLIVVAGIWLGGTIDSRHRNLWVLVFGLLLALGLAPGLAGVSLPYATAIVRGSLFLFGLALAFRKRIPAAIGLPIAVVAIASQAWHMGETMAIDVSLPIANAVGAAAVAVAVAHASLRGRVRGAAFPAGVRIIGASAAVLAVVWRIGEVHAWFDESVATEAALGLIEIPVASLLLLVVAAAMWPRRSRALRDLGVETRTPVAHWVLLGLAFFLISIGTWAAPNPFFEPHAPAGDEAKRLVGRMLANTYHAFNLSDEDELYDRLAESVSGELVADLYLDSRRRLTAGTREGAKVTVRDVSVLEIDDSPATADAAAGFAYRCKWVVTARVQHMQHVHHRQNIYNGVLTIRIDDDRWKIAGVELLSEDRVVLPWTAG